MNPIIDDATIAEQLKRNSAEIRNAPAEKQRELHAEKTKLLEPKEKQIFRDLMSLTEHTYLMDEKGDFVFKTARFPIPSNSMAMNALVEANMKSLTDAGIDAKLETAGDGRRTITVDPAQEGFFGHLKAALGMAAEAGAVR